MATGADVFELARLQGVIEGKVPLRAADRLRAALRDESGAVDFRLEGFIDEQRRPAARLFVRADLPLVCDRCGAPLSLHVERHATFYFAHNESEVAAAPVTADEQAEPLLGDTAFDVDALVEDETILSIPISPRHEECSPSRDDGDMRTNGSGRNPFTLLPDLLRNKSR